MRFFKETIACIAIGVLIAIIGVMVASLILRTYASNRVSIFTSDEFENNVDMEISIQEAIHPLAPSSSPRY